MLQLFYRTMLVFMLFSISCFSQQQEFIKGKVLDSNTEEPIAFATIRSKNEAIGVISNMDGTFNIPERFKTYGDTLEVSSMGYKSREILISTLSKDKAHKIYLRPSIIGLTEVIVKAKRNRKRKISASQIIRRAIANIRNNYPVHPFSIVGYYRDYQLKDKKYINLNEAILEVVDAGFLKPDFTDTKVSIYDYRPNTDFERDTLADNIYNYDNGRKILDNAYLFNYGGNEFTILRVHDAIRNYDVSAYSFVDRLDKDLLNNHNFNKVERTSVGNEVLFKIPFLKTNEDYSAFGTLFISTIDYTIHKMDYALYDLRKRKSNGVLNAHDTPGKLIFEVITEYQKKEGKMYLNYISFHNRFQLITQSVFSVEEVIFDAESSRFEVKFNNEPEERSSLKNRNYDFSFDGKKIQFDKIEHFKKKVFLYPKLDNPSDREMFKQLAKVALFNKVNRKLLKLDFDKIKDIQGNVINQIYYEDFDQYREFFVQEIKPKSIFLNDTLFMDKSKPIFKDQPIVRPDNFDDYWMNTPLKTSE